jgi:tetratricopeptide (TPR) repeat protein
MGGKAQARENYEQAHAVFKELTASDPENVDWQQDLAMTYRRLGEVALGQKRRDEALKFLDSALPIFESLSLKSPENIKRKNELADLRSIISKV